MKREVVISLQGAPDAYRDFIAMRNGNIAGAIADVLGGRYQGEFSESTERQYVVPATTITRSQAEAMGITSPEDFYGTVVTSMDEVGKAILHPSISEVTPEFHSARFVERVKDLVLPGVAGFTKEDLLKAYESRELLQYDLRLKLPNESDGNGQYVLSSFEQLKRLLDIIGSEFLIEHGLILEADVKNPETVSVGCLKVAGETYAFLAHQKNDSVLEKDETGAIHERSRYRGAFITIMPSSDGIGGLLTLPELSDTERDAITKTAAFYAAYEEEIGPMVSRISFDYITGTDVIGNPLAGITDITGRLGGYCGALLLGVQEIQKRRQAESIRRRPVRYIEGESTLNYQPSVTLPEEEGATVFMEHPALRITARVNSINM